jgi:hypothetical protein
VSCCIYSDLRAVEVDRSIERVRVMVGRHGEAIRCDPNAKSHGKRPLNARRLQRKQTTLKSVNITHACEMRGSRWRTDASLSNFLCDGEIDCWHGRMMRIRGVSTRRAHDPAGFKPDAVSASRLGCLRCSNPLSPKWPFLDAVTTREYCYVFRR